MLYKHGETKHLTTEMKHQIDWRQNKVLELSSQGFSEREIAEVIKVSDTTVHRDLVHLREQAQESLQHHISEVIPAEHQRCLINRPSSLSLNCLSR
jgi:DNA-binding NarL/FixJ family response regulator